MSIKLQEADFRTLVAVVKSLPGFANVRDRRRLIEGAFGGAPVAETIIGMLDLDGAPDLVAVEVIARLSDYGQIEYGKEALGVFLNGVIAAVGQEQANKLRELFRRYPLDGTIALQPRAKPWTAGPSSAFQEKVIGENTMFPVFVFQRALEASRSVVHLQMRSARTGSLWYGTAFLIADDLLITNHHVVGSEDAAAETTVSFDYQLGLDGKPCPKTELIPKKGGLFCACEELDYAVLQLPSSAKVPALSLGRSVPAAGEPVTVIQHPNGHLKQISLRNNAVQYSDQRRIHYTTSTEPGASGAPLLGHKTFDVVGLHHGGGDLTDPASGAPCFRNEAITMTAILDDLKERSAEIYERLTTS
jgi:S1-C subfamily serine protease